MKKIFLVWNITKNGKSCAFADTIQTGNNLLNFVECYESANICHICETRKQADDTARAWNQVYKDNNRYLELYY